MMLIVVPPKRIDLLLRVLERREPVHVQTFFAEPSIKRFDGGVVGRLATAAEVEDHAVGVRPQVHRGTHELGAVVAVDPLRQSALEPQPLQCGGDILAAEALTDVDRQAFPREEIDDGERSESPTIRQLVGHEVHAPDVVPRGRGSSLLAMHGRHVSPRPFAPQSQAFLGVHAIDARFADRPAFALQQHTQPAISESDSGLRELAHALSQGGERVLPASVVHRRARGAHDETRASGADGVAAHQVLHNLTLLDGL